MNLQWGEAGRLPQHHVRAFGSEPDATAYIAAQVAKQRDKGFVEIAAVAPTATQRERTVRLETPVETKSGERYREVEILEQRGTVIRRRRGTRKAGVDNFLPMEDDDTFTATDADRYVDDYVQNQIYQGAELVDRAADVATAPHSHAALEAACRAAPDDPATWAVYADWLIAQGDVVGEIASRAAGGHEAEAIAMITQLFDEVLGEDATLPELVFRHGFVVGATFAPDQDATTDLATATRDFLAAPFARFVESLRFGLAGFESNNDWGPTLRAVTASTCAPHVRALRFDNYTYEDQEISWTGFGDFSFAWEHLPSLEVLKIRAGISGTLGKLHLPSLKTFIRESGGLAAEELAAMAKATWPALEHLEIWFGHRHYNATGTLEMLMKILANKLPRLAHLGVVNCEFVDEAIPALAAWPGLARLSSLDLSKGVLHARGAAHLVKHADAFRHLASLDLSENLLDGDHIRAIRGVLDNAICNDQREHDADDDDDDDDDHSRYVALGE